MYRQGFVGAPTFCFDRACQCVLAPLYFANQVTNQDHNPPIDSLKISMNWPAQHDSNVRPTP